MTSPVVSGIIQEILGALNDETAATYPSGSVQLMLFKSIPILNGIMGTSFSGTYEEGVISPEISGTVYLGVLESYVAKELTLKSLYSAARTSNLLTVSEGDSKVTMSDSHKTLSQLYKDLSEQFNILVKNVKYTIVSQAPASVHGTDASITPNMPNLTNRTYPFRY